MKMGNVTSTNLIRASLPFSSSQIWCFYGNGYPFYLIMDCLNDDVLVCWSIQAHQNLADSDKKRICKIIDFQKLSPEAGAHAAQNERLPLQSIVQVLYFEQLRLRNSLCSSYPDDEPKPLHQSWRINSGALSAALSPRDNYASLRRENRELKLELARLRMRLNDLEKDHVCMKKNMEKSNSHKFMSSFAKKMVKLNFFGVSYSRASSSPSRHSHRTDSKIVEKAYMSAIWELQLIISITLNVRFYLQFPVC